MADVVQVISPEARAMWAPQGVFPAEGENAGAAPSRPHTLVSIPVGRTFEVSELWLPHFQTFARRRSAKAIYAAIERGEVQIHLVYDGSQAVAAIGTRTFEHETDRVADLVWCGGRSIPAIVGAIPELEQILGEQGCSRIVVTGREGLERVLRPLGYRKSQITLEKTANV